MFQSKPSISFPRNRKSADGDYFLHTREPEGSSTEATGKAFTLDPVERRAPGWGWRVFLAGKPMNDSGKLGLFSHSMYLCARRD